MNEDSTPGRGGEDESLNDDTKRSCDELNQSSRSM